MLLCDYVLLMRVLLLGLLDGCCLLCCLRVACVMAVIVFVVFGWFYSAGGFGFVAACVCGLVIAVVLLP